MFYASGNRHCVAGKQYHLLPGSLSRGIYMVKISTPEATSMTRVAENNLYPSRHLS